MWYLVEEVPYEPFRRRDKIHEVRHDHPLEVGPLHDLFHVDEVRVKADDRFDAGVLYHVLYLECRVDGRHGHRHRAYAVDREIGDYPLRAVRYVQHHPVLLFDAQVGKSPRKFMHQGFQTAVCKCLPEIYKRRPRCVFLTHFLKTSKCTFLFQGCHASPLTRRNRRISRRDCPSVPHASPRAHSSRSRGYIRNR